MAKARADRVSEAVCDPRRIASIRKCARKTISDLQTALGQRQQHDAAVRREATAVEIGCDFLARDGWKRERRNRSVGYGERGWRNVLKRIGLSNQILRRIRALRHTCQPQNIHVANKNG